MCPGAIGRESFVRLTLALIYSEIDVLVNRAGDECTIVKQSRVKRPIQGHAQH